MKQLSRADKSVVFDIMDTISAPVLTHDQSWADTIPKRLLDRVIDARLISAMLGEDYASYLEALIFMYTRTLTAPMQNDWHEIYMHVFCTVMEQCFSEDHWEEFEARRKLDAYKNDLLMQLRRWIYTKRRVHLKGRMKTSISAAIAAPNEIEEIGQLTFNFD